MTEKPGIVELTNELIFQRYRMDHGKLRQYFEDLNIPEYIALHIIASAASDNALHAGKTYLQDIADKMQISMRRTSKLVGDLQDKGFVRWAHDGNGDDGTYVVITDSGTTLMNDQEQQLKAYYGRVIETYGKDNMIQLLRLLAQLETVMNSELEGTEDLSDVDRTDA